MPLREVHNRAAADIGKTSIDLSGSTRPGQSELGLAGGEPEYLSWGDGPAACQVLATIGSVELEYAAIRRGVAFVDAANRTAVHVRGVDARDLLDRLVTQKIADLSEGGLAQGFLLDRTGRILADLVIGHLSDGEMMIEIDRTDVETVVSAIQDMVFVDDVQICSDETAYVFEIHGPSVAELLQNAGAELPDEGRLTSYENIGTMLRLDTLGVPGVRICLNLDSVLDVWSRLESEGQKGDYPCRLAGWYAFNMARVESLTPWAHIDFGPTSLPHETGLLAKRVSFTKGCYPGQEVVARMENLGHPKQILRSLSLPDERLPIAGGQVFALGESAPGDPIGNITSSTPSPRHGGRSVAMAVMKWSAADSGTPVQVFADGEFVQAVVEDIPG